MNNLDKQYLALVQDIIDNGVVKSDRTGTGTKSVFGRQIRHKMSEGFPLLTTKKVHFPSVWKELVWFLSGNTNIKWLVDNDCMIWVGDAYKRYMDEWLHENFPPFGGPFDNSIVPLSRDQFIDKIKMDEEFAKIYGELGPIYGKQWRNWRSEMGYIDQIRNLIHGLKENPDSRRLMVTAWNPADIKDVVLPPCHYGFQCWTREDTHGVRCLSLIWNQRSVDTGLGLPFNIASYGLLLTMLADEVGMIPDELIGNLGDTHLYLDHIELIKEQLTREPYQLPDLSIQDGIMSNCESDFLLRNYKHHPSIKLPLSN